MEYRTIIIEYVPLNPLPVPILKRDPFPDPYDEIISEDVEVPWSEIPLGNRIPGRERSPFVPPNTDDIN